MSYHVVIAALPSRLDRDVMPCLRDERHANGKGFI